METVRIEDLLVLTKKDVDFIVLERKEEQARIAIFGRIGMIKGVQISPKIFPKRSFSENLKILNDFYFGVEKAIEALEDISIVLSDHEEILEEIKSLARKTWSFRESYIKLLERIRDIKKVQTRLYLKEDEYCDLCGRKGETFPVKGYNLCKECSDMVNKEAIPNELLRERIRMSTSERKLLKQICKINPLTFEKLQTILTDSSKWEDYRKLKTKGYIEENRKVFPSIITLTEKGRRIVKIC